MEDPINPISHNENHHHEFHQNDVGLPTPPLDNNDLPFFSHLDDVTPDNFDFELDFDPFNADFDFGLDFSVDDLSFADNLLLQQPHPNSDSIILPSDIVQDRANPNSDVSENNRSSERRFLASDISDDRVNRNSDDSGGDVRIYNCSSTESNFLGTNSPEIGNLNSDSSVYSGRKIVTVDDAQTSNQDTKNHSSSSDSISNCLLKSKRKKELEQDHAAGTRSNKFRRSNANANSSDENVERIRVGESADDDDKRKTRLIRNRESAHLSRQRKKQYVEELEDKVKSMMSTITDLNSKISYFMTENATLRQQLSGGVAGPGMYPPYPMAGMPYPWMPYPPAYMVKPQGSNVPLVPIPRLKPQQPAPAPKVKKSSEGKKEKGEGKMKKVASVSLLGLLFFMFLFAGLVPIINIRYGKVGEGFGGVQKGAVFTVDKHVERFGHGRVLPQSNSSNVGNASEPLVASLYVPRNDQLVKIDGNLIIHSVLASERAITSNIAVGTETSEETGLAIHESYPPYPTPGPGSNNWRHPHLDRNQNGRQRALGSGSTDFTPIASDGKVQQWFREGLAGPMLSSGMCTEVFQFDVSPTPGSIIPATSVANITSDDRLNHTRPNQTKNRRILPGHAIPLYDHTTLNTSKEHVQPHEQNDGLQGNKSRSSVVVSVLVDPREVGDGDGESILGSKTLSRIFVVVLIDSVKYVTYSCILPFMGSSSYQITA